MFCEGHYIYEHRGHRISRDSAGHDLYGELEPRRRRQPPVECQDTHFDKEYRDEVLDLEQEPNFQAIGVISWIECLLLPLSQSEVGQFVRLRV